MTPLIPPGIAGVFGSTVTVIQFWVPELQLLLAFTQTLPAVVPKSTVMVFVPCPAVIVAPAGTVHV